MTEENIKFLLEKRPLQFQVYEDLKKLNMNGFEFLDLSFVDFHDLEMPYLVFETKYNKLKINIEFKDKNRILFRAIVNDSIIEEDEFYNWNINYFLNFINNIDMKKL